MGWLVHLFKDPLVKPLLKVGARGAVRLVFGLALTFSMAILLGCAGPSLAQTSAGQQVACPAGDPDSFCTLIGHKNWVRNLTFSPGGKYLASASNDSTIRIWDMATGQSVRTLVGHKHFVSAVAFSPDGKFLVSASFDKTLKLWDLVDNKEMATLTGHDNSIYAMAISPDGKLLASGSSAEDNNIMLWDLRAGQALHRLKGHEGPVESLAISPDGKYLASGSSDKTIKLWDLKSSQPRAVGLLRGHDNAVNMVVFNPDGKTLVSAASDHTIRIWDLAKGRESQVISNPAMGTYDLAISPDGNFLACDACGLRKDSCQQANILIWNAATGEKVRTLVDPEARYANALAFSPDGRHLAAGVSLPEDKGIHPIRVWYIGDIIGAPLKTIVTEPALVSDMQHLQDPHGAYLISIPNRWQPHVVEGGISAVNPETELHLRTESAPKEYGDIITWAKAYIGNLEKKYSPFELRSKDKAMVMGFPSVILEWLGGPAGHGHVTRCILIMTNSQQISLVLTSPVDNVKQNQKDLQAIIASFEVHETGSGPAPQPEPQPKPKPAPQPAPVTNGLQTLTDSNRVCTLQVPPDWELQKTSLGMEAQTPQGEAWVSLTSSFNDGTSADQWAERVAQINKNNKTDWKETKRNTLEVDGIPVLHIFASYSDDRGNPFVEDLFFALTDRFKVLLEFERPSNKAEALHPALVNIYRSWRFATDNAGLQPSPAPGPQPTPQPAPPPAPQPLPQPGPLVTPQPESLPQPQPAPLPQPPVVTGQSRQVQDPNGVFSFQAPPDWQVQRQGSVIMVHSPDQRANAVAVSEARGSSALGQWAQAMVQTWQQQIPGWQMVGQQPITIAGRQAILIRASSRTQGVDMHADYILVHTDQHQVMMALNCPKADFPRLQLTFGHIVASLELGAAPAPPPAPLPDQGAQQPPTPPQPPAPQPTPQPEPVGMKPVRDQGGAFALSVPADWSVQQQMGVVMATAPGGLAQIAVMAMPKQAMNLEQFAQNMTEQWKLNIPNWRQMSRHDLQVSGRNALLIQASGTPAGQYHLADYFLLLTDNHQILMIFSSPQEQYQSLLPIFQQVFSSFRVN